MYFDTANEKISPPCKPDPEESLQRSRKRLEELEKAKVNLMMGAKGSYDAPSEAKNGILMAIGSLEFAILTTQNDVEYWLKEIDSGE